MVGLVVIRAFGRNISTAVTPTGVEHGMDMLRSHHVSAANTKESVFGHFPGGIPRKRYSGELVIPVPCSRLRWSLLPSSLDQIFIALAP